MSGPLKGSLVALVLALSLPVHAANLTPVKRVEPSYPPAAARAGTTGFVEVEFDVNPEGKVYSVSVINAKPARTFEQAAVKAVKQWEFQPGGGKGKVRLDFKL